MIKTLSTALLALLLVACSLFQAADHPIEQSPNDKRAYQSLTLTNGLQVLLISDADADFAAASLDVAVGSGGDPAERQGLAHFLEHMLFLGTAKYPQPDAYQAFIKENGGSHNAYTSFEHTNYFFTVKPGALEPALDRFAQFFISPLFNEEYVEREKHAVDSEYHARIDNESRRSLDVFKQLVNPAHPFAKFSVGNLETLSSAKTPIRDDLIAFYHKYYSAHNMRLVVMGRDSLPQLQQWVESKFNAVADFPVDDNTITEPLFTQGYLPKWVNIQPEQQLREMTLLFPLADQQPYYHSKPLTLIGHILGHEGQGSLLAYLKQKNWAEGLSAGDGINYRGGSSLALSIALTEEGYRHQQQVVEAVFQAIERLQQKGVPEWVFTEVAKVAQLGFQFQESVDAQHYVTRLANAMQYYPVAEVLTGDQLLSEYKPQLINAVLAQLTLDNCLITVIGDGFEADAQSPFYATPYRVSEIPETLRQSLAHLTVNASIRLPEPNHLLPENLQLVVADDDKTEPDLLLQQPGVQLWYKGIDGFVLPKATAYYSFQHAGIPQTVTDAVKLELYVALLNDSLNTWVYPAQMAGLGFQLYPHQRGITLKIFGFNDKQPQLLALISNQLHQLAFSEVQFARLKAEKQQNLQNSQMQPPYVQLSRYWQQLMQPKNWPEEEKLAALENLTLDDVEQFAAAFWQGVQVTAMNSGNVTPQQARAMLQQLVKPLQLAKAVPDALQVYKLPAYGMQQVVSTGHNDAGYLLYWQAEDASRLQQANWLLLAKVLEAGFFNQLRTEQQLGYVVYASYAPLLQVPGMMFVVQSPRAGVADIHRSTQAFLQQADQRLAQLDAEQFQRFTQGLLQQLREKPTNLQQESDQFWYELALTPGVFNQNLALAEELETLNLDDWRKAMQAALASRPASSLLLATDKVGDAAYRMSSGSDAMSAMGRYAY